MPISEADIIKPFIERDQLNRKTKATSGQKTGNGKKSDELDEILEEREQIPVLDIEKLVIEKLEAKIGQSIPFHEYKAKMPDLCYYAGARACHEITDPESKSDLYTGSH